MGPRIRQRLERAVRHYASACWGLPKLSVIYRDNVASIRVAEEIGARSKGDVEINSSRCVITARALLAVVPVEDPPLARQSLVDDSAGPVGLSSTTVDAPQPAGGLAMSKRLTAGVDLLDQRREAALGFAGSSVMGAAARPAQAPQPWPAPSPGRSTPSPTPSKATFAPPGPPLVWLAQLLGTTPVRLAESSDRVVLVPAFIGLGAPYWGCW